MRIIDFSFRESRFLQQAKRGSNEFSLYLF